MDCLKSECLCLRPRSSTTMSAGLAPAALYSSARRKALMEPPKPVPAIRTSTRSGKVALLGALLGELLAVGEAAVAPGRRARQSHYPVARCLGRGLLGDQRGGAERRERHGRRRLPQDAGRVRERQPVDANLHPVVEAHAHELAAVLEGACGEVREERSLEGVEADQRVVVE